MRSDCPLNYALELFGDKWSLLIIRDMVFFDKRYYQEFLLSEEKISTNILANRLLMLEKNGFIKKKKAPDHKQKIVYSLTEKAIDLVPMIIEIGLWSDKHGHHIPAYKKELILKDVKINKLNALQQLKDKLYRKHISS
ncbi:MULTISPECIES: winged helix-turn-helix transcriptional regulator [Olivibacter]|uniref:Transcriptional regulator, HxlR family n=2 Tax=Sphingobacteriaceae TaxID=84566 RepID=F4C8K2_SPHS2|nr:helix-turn-helix transcriptional regulator [Olivibacter sp. UJ_SKK_5.1]MDX3914413.1 helix-turn-helix domain-containing protein [Pseudosphingobacterium sp.]